MSQPVNKRIRLDCGDDVPSRAVASGGGDAPSLAVASGGGDAPSLAVASGDDDVPSIAVASDGGDGAAAAAGAATHPANYQDDNIIQQMPDDDPVHPIKLMALKRGAFQINPSTHIAFVKHCQPSFKKAKQLFELLSFMNSLSNITSEWDQVMMCEGVWISVMNYGKALWFLVIRSSGSVYQILDKTIAGLILTNRWYVSFNGKYILDFKATVHPKSDQEAYQYASKYSKNFISKVFKTVKFMNHNTELLSDDEYFSYDMVRIKCNYTKDGNPVYITIQMKDDDDDDDDDGKVPLLYEYIDQEAEETIGNTYNVLYVDEDALCDMTSG